MIPIHELISKIRWDEEFGKGDFAIGYYDRMLDKILIVPFHEIYFDPADHFSFQIVTEDGETHRIPLHRVREVYKDGALIWHRQALSFMIDARADNLKTGITNGEC